MALVDAEIQSLRFHLGYGNVSTGAYPYVSDGWHEVFESVISPNLQDGAETTSATAVTAGSTTTITVASGTDLVSNARLVIDVGDNAEIVVARNVSGVSVTAYFVNAHTGTYPVALMSGIARLRMMLHAADKAWTHLQSSGLSTGAGVKKVDEVEFFDPRSGGKSAQLAGARAHYESIVGDISSLVRVEPRWARERSARRRLESY